MATDPENWIFDVFIASHDDLKAGVLARRWSTVVISRKEFPDSVAASEAAACLAVAVNGGMPTAVLPVY